MSLRSITATYPGFHALPKGIKQMLLVSESAFFDEARPASLSPSAPIATIHAEDNRDQRPLDYLPLPPTPDAIPHPSLRAD